MREHVQARRTPDEDRVHLCFALAKALEDRGDYEESFRFYERGNALRSLQSPLPGRVLERTLREQTRLCTRQFFEERAG